MANPAGHRALPALALLAALPLAGCLLESITSPIDSLSGSVEAIGGSLAGISRSLTSPVTSSTIDPTYRRDVRVFTEGFVRSGAIDPDEFQRGVSQIAARHGIAHWEGEPETVRAIGEGLRRAGASDEQVEQLAVRLGESGAATAELLFAGYRGGS
jgi:hypothetical protein